MTISKRLAELMGGDISVQSIRGLGSRFCCRISAGCDALNDEMINSLDQVDPTHPGYQQPEEGLVLKGRILLVEDTFEIQQLVKAMLEDYGIDIDTADNGEQGVQMALANEQQYDLVLMDIQMPVMDGKQATRQLRANNFSKPILALTADALAQHAEEFMRAGFTEVLTKPIVMNDLITRMGSYLAAGDKAIADDTLAATQDAAQSEAEIAYRDLQHKFVRQLPRYLEKINRAMQQQDVEEAGRVLHSLKGMGGSFGYPEITRLAQDAGEALRINDSDAVAEKLEQMADYCLQNRTRRSA